MGNYLMELVRIPDSWGVLREPRTPPHQRNMMRHGLSFDEQFDWDILFSDVIDIGDNRILCIGGPLYELADLIKFSDGTKILNHEIYQLDRTCITLVHYTDSYDNLQLVHSKENVPVKVFEPSTIFKGIGFVTTMQKNEPVSWIKEWLQYYYVEYGVKGFLLYNNNCTDYTTEELQSELRSMYHDIVVEVVDWNVPYGPQTPAWDSDFAQYTQFEHCKYKYGWCSPYVLNHDIDELLVTKEGLGIDGILGFMKQNGVAAIVYGNRNLNAYNVHLEESSHLIDNQEIHYKDYYHYMDEENNPNFWGERSITKWIIIPEMAMDCQWKTHYIDGNSKFIHLPKDNESIYFAHFYSMKSVNKLDHESTVDQSNSTSNLKVDYLLKGRLQHAFS